MTLPSQFSLEEENFYKDIQDLVKKGSQNGRELSLFLEQYKDLLAKADLDDETFIINFAKAGLIIEASAKVYGIKVDGLWTNLEHILESLKNKGSLQNKKKKNGENDIELDDDNFDDINDEDKRKGLGFARRRKKLGDALFSSDDFLEINSITGLCDKNMNESNSTIDSKVKFCEKIPHMFIKTKIKKKKIDISLDKCLDKDIIRLRDWIISAEGLLVKEIYTSLPDNICMLSRLLDYEEAKNVDVTETYLTNDPKKFDGTNKILDSDVRLGPSLKGEENNNFETESALMNSNTNRMSVINENSLVLNDISKESDVARFSNVIERMPGDCLVDVDEVFWNPSKFQDVIPSKKRRSGKTSKISCQLCIDKKSHVKKGKRCLEGKQKLECLDSYFTPHVQPTLTEPQFGILPDEELYSAYKTEIKLIEQLKKADCNKNANGAFFPNENAEGLISFLGFDGFDSNLIKKSDLTEDPIPNDNAIFDCLDDDIEPFADDLNTDKDLELPLPVVENDFNNRQTALRLHDKGELEPNDNLRNAEAEYQKLVTEELKEHYAAKSSFAKNKELGIKISKWFEMIGGKIKLAEKRGALNMKVLSIEIMEACAAEESRDKNLLRFQDLVHNRCQRDVPRYFFACLQLANEGNLEISKSSNHSLVTDCMLIKRLKEIVFSRHSNEHSVLNSSKKIDSPNINLMTKFKRKRNSSDSSPTVESKIREKQKRPKRNLVKSCKRPKILNPSKNLKKQRCSLSSLDSLTSGD